MSDNMSLAEAAEKLGVHYMTAYRYVRTGRLPAVKQGATWMVQRADVDAFGHTAATPTRRRGGSRAAMPLRLEDRLVQGDEAGAWQVVDDAVAGSMPLADVYTDLLAPALASIGEKWARHELDIEAEHQATTIATRLIGRLGPRFTRPGRRRGTVVLGAPAGDDHSLPVLIVADLVRLHGFNVVDLGANTPPGAFGRSAQRADSVVAVGVCATAPDNIESVRDALIAIAASCPARIVLGGGGVSDAIVDELAATLDADVWSRVYRTQSAADALEAIEGATTKPTASKPTAARARVAKNAAEPGVDDLGDAAAAGL
jgi:excisionase family DNA binding protein